MDDTDDEKLGVRAKKMMKRPEALPSLSLRMIGSLLTMAILVWTIRCGFMLAMEPWKYTAYAVTGFHIGITIMLLGFLFLIVGLSILADWFLNISDQLQEMPGTPQVKEKRTTRARGVLTLFVMSFISWTIYIGFRLADESRNANKHHLLTVSIGLMTITFGLIYFIIGISIVIELALDLLSHLQKK